MSGPKQKDIKTLLIKMKICNYYLRVVSREWLYKKSYIDEKRKKINAKKKITKCESSIIKR